MKLKNLLILVFLTLTLIPIFAASLLLYKSGFSLSKESYTRNLIESIHVQEDYITQTIANNMVSDSRFAHRRDVLLHDGSLSPETQRVALLAAFQFYLESSTDKIASAILLDQDDVPIYTIGEKGILNVIGMQLPQLSGLKNQVLMEFQLEQGTYSLGIITPVRDAADVYMGSLVSIYDKSYIFKIISSYYEIVDTSTYICRGNGEIVNYRGLSDEKRNAAATQALHDVAFVEEGMLDLNIDGISVSGFYKNIHTSPWYLVGLIDDELIYAFTNQFVLGYVFIIIGVLIADVLLSFYFSQKVVKPINGLIKVMEGYPNSLNSSDLEYHPKSGYYETQYLRTKFLNLMERISLIQHNFEGIYQLYQSNDMDDVNIDIDVKQQTIFSNKESFQTLIRELVVPSEACIVERFTNCFCEQDQKLLMAMFENMRDEHLSVACEAEVYTPLLGQKWFHSLVVPMYENDRLSRLFVQLRDVTHFKKQEFQSNEQARRDSLTGLYNRTGFSASVEKVLQGCSEDLHGLLFIDMDYFKLVNDNLGHSAGDALLKAVGSILLETVGPDDIVSRFGGDEFTVFLPRTTQETIEKTKEMLGQRLVYPYHTDQVSFVVSASIGVSIWNRTSADTLEKLLQQADAAMYRSKRERKQHIIS